MIVRKRLIEKVKIDYDWHKTRHMCDGCNKVYAGGRTLLGFICTMWNNRTIPGMYVRADQCPMNPRLKPLKGPKTHVGQGKTKAGGNR